MGQDTLGNAAGSGCSGLSRLLRGTDYSYISDALHHLLWNWGTLYIVSTDGHTLTYKSPEVKRVLEVSSETPQDNFMFIPHSLFRGELLEKKITIGLKLSKFSSKIYGKFQFVFHHKNKEAL